MPKTFILVHGAWHGGWCWQRVADLLEARGHKVHAPTLTGLAERRSELAPGIDLSTHAADVTDLVTRESLGNIVLVGHSYGGMVITQVAEKIGSAIASLVYLDAFLPEPGQSLLDLASPGTREALAKAIASGATTIAPIPAAAFKVNEADQAWVDARCTPQPAATMTQAVSGIEGRDGVLAKTYIRASGYPSASFDAGLAKARNLKGWRTYEVACGHDVMLDAPQRLAEILLEVA